MPTILDKDLVRESTVRVDNREILITLSSEQKIRMKLKGMKSGEVSIDIQELYNQLTGNTTKKEETNTIKSIKREEKQSEDILISLYDLRSLNAISGFDVPMMNKFDAMISELIQDRKKQKKK